MSTNTTIRELKECFNINTDITDVNFVRLNVEPYHSLQQPHKFGEKKCLFYRIELSVLNIQIALRILAFKYESYTEVLKLEINICNDSVLKEIASCKNFLQRKRNINLTFEVLIKFAKLYEARRLIRLTVFQKHQNVLINCDEGLTAKCCSKNLRETLLELHWSITWHVDSYEVMDFIEFYLNSATLDKTIIDKIKQKLNVLVQPAVEFQNKLKLWKSVMENLNGTTTANPPTSRKVMTKSSDVLEISDSESDVSVIEIESSAYTPPSSEEIMVID